MAATHRLDLVCVHDHRIRHVCEHFPSKSWGQKWSPLGLSLLLRCRHSPARHQDYHLLLFQYDCASLFVRLLLQVFFPALRYRKVEEYLYLSMVVGGLLKVPGVQLGNGSSVTWTDLDSRNSDWTEHNQLP